MSHLDELNQLITKASERAGSDAKLARSIGVPPQHVSNWRHGHKTCTPADQALMAHVAGLDPVVTLARATVQQYEGKAKGDALMKVLGKALLVTGAAVGSAGASAAAIFSSIPAPTGLTGNVLAAIYTMYRRSNAAIQYRLCQVIPA